MHISEGVLSGPVLAAGAALALAGICLGLKHADRENLPLCGILSAAFFVASLIHVPIGPGNAHLILNGLLGVFLGWMAFPAILLALVFQAILFQYGGITTLGVNTFTMAFSAVLAGYLFRWLLSLFAGRSGILIAAFCAGFAGVALAAALTAMALAWTSEGFKTAAWALLIAHIPVMIAEGIITAITVSFIARVSPATLWPNGHNPQPQRNPI